MYLGVPMICPVAVRLVCSSAKRSTIPAATLGDTGGVEHVATAALLFARHVCQLEGGSPLSNSMEVKEVMRQQRDPRPLLFRGSRCGDHQSRPSCLSWWRIWGCSRSPDHTAVADTSLLSRVAQFVCPDRRTPNSRKDP